MKSSLKRSVVIGMVAILSQASLAAYDEEGGYVTLTLNEYEAAANFKSSMTTAGSWSDGEAPHAGTNYYAQGICFYPCTFHGDSLTASGLRRMFGNTTWANMEWSPVVINDLRIVDKGRIAQFGSTCPIVFKGKLTVLGAMDVVGGQVSATTGEAGWIALRMDIVGDEQSKIAFMADDGRNAAKAGNPQFMSGTMVYGDTDAFHGSVEVWMNQTLVLGKHGFKNAQSVKLTSAWSRLTTAAPAGAVVPVSSIETVMASTLTLPVSNALSVANLNLADGTVIDCSSAGESSAIYDGGIVVTKSLALGGKVKLSMGDVQTMPSHAIRVISVPTSVGNLDESDFDLSDLNPRYVRVEIRTTENSCEVFLVNEGPSLPRLPTTFDESAGYVTLTKSDDFTVNSFERIGNWSDGLAPHKGTNYFVNAKWLYAIGTYPTFHGDRLVFDGSIRFSSGGNPHFGDLWAVSNGKAKKEECTMFTTVGGISNAVTTSAESSFTVFANEKSPFVFLGGRYGLPWRIRSKLIGDTASCIYFACHPQYDGRVGEDEVQFGGELIGDTSEYYGTVKVDWNCLFRLGANGLPHGTLKIVNPDSSKVTSEAATNATIHVRELIAHEGANLEPQAGNVFSFDCVTAAKTVVKSGAGVLSFGTVESVADGTVLKVYDGCIWPRTERSFDGFAIDFANDTGFCVSIDDADAVLKTDCAIVVAGDIRCTILGLDGSGLVSGIRNVAKLKADEAVKLYNALCVSRVKGYKLSKTISETNEDGYCTVSVRFVQSGFVFVVR